MKKYILSVLLLFCAVGIGLGSELESVSLEEGRKDFYMSFIKRAKKKLPEPAIEFLVKNMKITKHFLFFKEGGDGSSCSLFLIKLNNTDQEFHLMPVSDHDLFVSKNKVDGINYIAAALCEENFSVDTKNCSAEEAQELTKDFSLLTDSELHRFIPKE